MHCAWLARVARTCHQADLNKVSHVPEAHDLISKMVASDPAKRPKTRVVLEHPLFQSDEARLSFLQVCVFLAQLRLVRTSLPSPPSLFFSLTHFLKSGWCPPALSVREQDPTMACVCELVGACSISVVCAAPTGL